MKFGSRQAIAGCLTFAMICLTGAGLAGGQTTPAAGGATQAKPAAKKTAATHTAAKTGNPAGHGQEMAGVYFKNVQVMKNIPVDEFMDTMGFFAASLSLNCIDCHVQESGGDWARYADDTQLKATTRKMVLMVNTINAANFGGAKEVTCWTCHRGGQQPTTIPSLLEQYSPPPPDDPNEYTITVVPKDTPNADQVFAKYLDALGGAQKLGAINTWVGKGTYEGFDTEHEANPFDIYAKSPDLRSQVAHFRIGDSKRIFNGSMAWISSPDKPQPIMTLTGGELLGARLDATALFPTQLKTVAANWKVGVTQIDDKDVWVLIGTTPAHSTVKLFFDKGTNYLVRLTRYDTTVIGTNPIQLDFEDYRDVNGVKLPFQLTTTWTDGQDIVKLNDIQVNAPIDASLFEKPGPPKMLPGSHQRQE